VTVSILRFHAGSTAYAVAAGNVLEVASARPGVPHLATVLGDAAPAGDRLLRIAAGGRGADVIVDGPVELVDLDVDDIAPCRNRAVANAAIMGFARDADRVFVLLDAANLVALLRS
jgi:hypothetical protein